METTFAVYIYTICMTVIFILAFLCWIKRKEVNDRARTILAIINSFFGPMLAVYITFLSAGKVSTVHAMFTPALCIGGFYAFVSIMYYPIEVIRPDWLKGRKLIYPLIPAFLVTIPLLFGIRFRDILSFNDIIEHWYSIDVLIRIFPVLYIAIGSLMFLFIPYNWRKSSADSHFIRMYVIFAEITAVFFFWNCLAGSQLVSDIHILWCTIFSLCLGYYELRMRVIPPVDTQDLPDEPEPIQEDQDDEDRADDLWQRISHQMEKHEIWRNPDASVEIMSRAVGTNRIYVADCIREHTGLTFNDYLNKWRTEYMADKLRQDPGQDQKPLYFEIGYRNRQTAYRNFIKFIGCSPSDYIASL